MQSSSRTEPKPEPVSVEELLRAQNVVRALAFRHESETLHALADCLGDYMETADAG